MRKITTAIYNTNMQKGSKSCALKMRLPNFIALQTSFFVNNTLRALLFEITAI